MFETSARLSMPYIQPAQAQKHITHNEALALLDVLVQACATSATVTVPPADPDLGECYLIPADAVDDWAGHTDQIAQFRSDGWQFTDPNAGYMVWIEDQGASLVYDGAAWQTPVSGSGGGGGFPVSVAGLGINGNFDAVNRLVVGSDGTLLTHDGAGHRLTVNKASASDTASLLFQSDWSGHAEMGLAGDTQFRIKVSADGGTWVDAFAIDPAAQSINLSPAGSVVFSVTDASAILDVPVQGLAVQSDAYDATDGKLLTTGAFGWGAQAVSADSGPVFGANASGVYAKLSTTPDAPTPSDGFAIKLTKQADQSAAIWVDQSVSPEVYVATDHSGAQSDWRKVVHSHNLVGTVAQSGGVPTGAVIEQGDTANGSYVRYADGTQMCWFTTATLTANGAAVGTTGFYKSAPAAWSYPAAFASDPTVTATVQALSGDAAQFASVDTGSLSAASCDFVLSGLQGATGQVHGIATGRWV
jgi:hypothetical protein